MFFAWNNTQKTDHHLEEVTCERRVVLVNRTRPTRFSHRLTRPSVGLPRMNDKCRSPPLLSDFGALGCTGLAVQNACLHPENAHGQGMKRGVGSVRAPVRGWAPHRRAAQRAAAHECQCQTSLKYIPGTPDAATIASPSPDAARMHHRRGNLGSTNTERHVLE